MAQSVVSLSDGVLSPPVTRRHLGKESLSAFPVALSSLFIFDTGQPLPAAPVEDDMGLIPGTYGTANPYLSAGDQKAAGAVSLYARLHLSVPHEYVQAETIKIRLSAGMKTTIADTTCTLGVEVYKIGRATVKSGSDLSLTTAQSINSLTFADKDFTLNGAGLSPGDQLDVRLTIAVNDGATVTAVTPAIGAIELLCDTKG